MSFKLNCPYCGHRLKVPPHAPRRLLVVHGKADTRLPYSCGQQVYDWAKEPKELFSVTGGTHNGLPFSAGNDYWEKPYQFVQKFL